MSNGIEFSEHRVAKVSVDSPWISANGRLPVCIGKSPRRVAEIANDEIAEQSSSYAQAILARNENGSSRVQTWFGGRAGLLLFPEYAFSSREFSTLDALVKDHPTPLIVIAGFGAVHGPELANLLDAGCTAA